LKYIELGPAGVTVTVAVPLCPSLVAVIVAAPCPCAVTSPLLLTVAIPAALVLHDTVRPESGFPAESRGVAVNCRVWPTVRLRLAGLTVTDATGTTTTATVTEADFPSLVAVIVAVPAALAVTSPLLLTVTTPAALVLHDTVRPESGFPAESRGVAVSCPVWPTVRSRPVGLTVIEATETEVTLTLAVPD